MSGAPHNCGAFFCRGPSDSGEALIGGLEALSEYAEVIAAHQQQEQRYRQSDPQRQRLRHAPARQVVVATLEQEYQRRPEAGKDQQGKGFDPRKLLKPGRDNIVARTKELMEEFGSVNKA